MSGCEEFEIAIEKRLHGALGAAEAAALDAHLAACAGCRMVEEATKKMEEDMRTTARALAGGMNREWMEWRVRVVAEANRRGFKQGLAVLAVMLPVIAWAGGAEAFAYGAAAGFLCLILALRAARVRARQAAEVERNCGDLVAFCRRDLDRRIAGVRRGWRWMPFLLVCLASPAILAAAGHDVSVREVVFGAIMAAIFLAAGAYARFVSLPRLERERAELD